MTGLLAFIALLFPWLTGAALLYSIAAWTLPRAAVHAPGALCWQFGAGAFLGYWLVTLLMRLYSLLGIPFSLTAIALPLLLLTALAAFFGWRRAPLQLSRETCPICALPQLTRYLFFALLAWLALRFGLLFFEVSTRPLFPWEASIQWASKAHAYYGLKSLVPFVDSTAWLNAPGNVYFDNAPNLPATLPLLQAWMCVAMGEWNDVLMNLPWWAMLLALAFAVYGFMRSQNIGPFASLITAWLVTSLPLLDTHVALAGLPDLPLTGAYTLAALSLMRWARSRQWNDLFYALLFALVAATLWPVAYVWLATLLPALVVTLFPSTARKMALTLPAVTVLTLLIITQTGASLSPALGNVHFDVSTDAWLSNSIKRENWHFVWIFALITTLAGRGKCLHDSIAPITTTALAGILVVATAISTPAFSTFFFGATQTTRALLIISSIVIIWFVLAWRNLFLSDAPTPETLGKH